MRLWTNDDAVEIKAHGTRIKDADGAECYALRQDDEFAVENYRGRAYGEAGQFVVSCRDQVGLASEVKLYDDVPDGVSLEADPLAFIPKVRSIEHLPSNEPMRTRLRVTLDDGEFVEHEYRSTDHREHQLVRAGIAIGEKYRGRS